MFDRIKKYLKSVELNYSIINDETIFMFGYISKGNYQCIIDINEENKIIVVYTIIGSLAIPERRNRIAKLLTKINFGLRIGNFEMDYEDGQIRYKTSVDYDGLKDYEDIFIENLIVSNIITTDKFYQAIEEGLHSRKSIEKILERF